MLQFIRHVLSFLLLSPLFQYISCCSLSETCGNESLYFVKFQYISCCSLSSFLLNRLSTLDSFNTSHVVVYLYQHLLLLPARQFQYISCCSLSINGLWNNSTHCVSIHLMLQFIHIQHRLKALFLLVSIHLMLQFIQRSRHLLSARILSFNTSHVVVYLTCLLKLSLSKPRFNTSHVVVYPEMILHLEHIDISFNTSHVVVYLETYSSNLVESMFQYISCCSLSDFFYLTSHTIIWFQYISCCSLSILILQCLILFHCFNTSHVVVYLLMGCIPLYGEFVSIHLMLQFILSFFNLHRHFGLFQYISCCSLSGNRTWHVAAGSAVSIHLMLQFIKNVII